MDNQWETINTTITIDAKATIGKREMTAKQKWIIPRTLEPMDERKQLKPLITIEKSRMVYVHTVDRSTPTPTKGSLPII